LLEICNIGIIVQLTGCKAARNQVYFGTVQTDGDSYNIFLWQLISIINRRNRPSHLTGIPTKN